MTGNTKPALENPFIAPLPEEMTVYPRGLYDPYPTFMPKMGKIQRGYEALARRIVEAIPRGLRVLAIDGYHGVGWQCIRDRLIRALGVRGVSASWVSMDECLALPEDIRRTAAPFLGGDDPLFGRAYSLGPEAFFSAERIAELRTRLSIARGVEAGSLLVLAGPGAGLLELWDELWYVDIPKDVIQDKARAGLLTALGESRRLSFGDFYKRSYFFDWPALNRLKRRLLPEIDLFLDGRNDEEPSSMEGEQFRSALHEIAASPFRVRPWFFPGPWGGQYMKGHMGLDPEQPNYAWSFELIVPENGITLEKDGTKLECSFDCLMFQEHLSVLGQEAGRQFKYEWPIRLDYLDTIDGGNLSTQAHPRPDYVRVQFGETFTQDETYYIVNAKPGARVFIGLTEQCDPLEFREALEKSQREHAMVAIDRFVHSEPSKPHDLFLIPNGTVHCSGSGNLVLEISSTPYIFTFKIYDYLRRDLDGNFRSINVDRAFDNIRFERRSTWVRENLLARPRLLREGEGWKEFVLSERPEFFYNIHRVEFDREYVLATEDRGFAANLVGGEEVELLAANGNAARLAYLESMIIPAAAGQVRIRNRGKQPCRLVLVYVRPGVGITNPLNHPVK
jgi:mannose-6-phosphate isomerase class I